jgi:hypothetical protein
MKIEMKISGPAMEALPKLLEVSYYGNEELRNSGGRCELIKHLLSINGLPPISTQELSMLRMINHAGNNSVIIEKESDALLLCKLENVVCKLYKEPTQ